MRRWLATRSAMSVVLLAVALWVVTPVQAADPAERWLPAMEKFSELDRQNPPEKGGIVFVGSSSIRMWKVDQWFPDLPVLNRGFGGSQISDSIYYVDRLILPYQPEIVVFYAGDNDIDGGKSPQRVADDYRQLIALVPDELPHTRVIFVAIKPSLARWELVGPMREANRMIADFSAADERLQYLDVDAPMIGADGKPRLELFVDDGLHMIDEGYRVWSELLRPLLGSAD